MKQFLLFKLKQCNYCLEIELIQEIIDQPALHFIPCAPNYYCGAVNFHGEILPVLDLDLYLGGDNVDSSSRVLVLTPRVASLALRVKTARQIVSIDSQALLPASDTTNSELKQSTFNLQGDDIAVLNLPWLLQNIKERAVITAQKLSIKAA